jgi:hypothetical protein
MLGKLVKTRAGRRIVVTIIVAILVISAIALYMGRQTGHTLPSTAQPGNAVMAGYPQTVNLTTIPSQNFGLTFSVLNRYVSGITLRIDPASDVNNASAYFLTSGTSFNTAANGTVVRSMSVSMQAGFRDKNITLVVTGNGNASGWIGIYQSAVLGLMTPSFVKVNVTSYHKTGGTHPGPHTKTYVRLDNLPAAITVPSGTKGTFQVNYTASNISGPLSWKSNISWIDVATLNSTAADANYTAPYVSANITFIANISVSYTNILENYSTLQITIVNTSHGVTNRTHGHIALDNLPAAITVPSGTKGTFQVNYTASNISGPLSWKSNISWIDVATLNSTAADANYTAPYVSANITFIANISVSYTNILENYSTLQITIVNTSHGVTNRTHGHIALDNLPAAINAPINNTTAFTINYTAVNVTYPLVWAANLSWIQVSTLSDLSAQANITPPTTLHYNRTLGNYGTFVVNISVASADNITNHSTLTVTVTGPPPKNVTEPGQGNYFVYTYQNLSVNKTFEDRGNRMYANVTAELVDAFLVNGTTMIKSFYNATITFRVAVGNVTSSDDTHHGDDGQSARDCSDHGNRDDGRGPGTITVMIKLSLNVSTSGNTVTNVSMVKMSVHVDHGKHKGQLDHHLAVELEDMPAFPLTVLFYSTGPPVNILTQIEGAPT